MVSQERPVVAAATNVELRALRRARTGARIVDCGVAFSRCDPTSLGLSVISCGIAGGLRAELPTGTLVIADRVRRPNGEELLCDRALVLQLAAAARRAGLEPVVAPILTSSSVVNGEQRARWAREGYAAADMESGLIVAPRVGVVRVVLDTPARELSAAWLYPARALANPLLWGQALWLALHAARCSAIAAAVVAQAWPPQ